ncbi:MULTISPECIES: DUF5076 domain-containing protein [Acidovorax]|uniref:DUF5076 domain-containing protein n=1 Tax=Acidovorax TaxID=12916 RepID=UPI0002377413|nr:MULTISPECIES: DUF5076 domain-containing protein [Acidovorax]
MTLEDDSPELPIPQEALNDPGAFEIMRLWAGGGQLHVMINSGLQGGAEDFGELLADLYEHAARLYAQRDEQTVAECRVLILEDFLRRTREPNVSVEGEIPKDH